MDRALDALTKAVAATAAVALLLAIVMMIEDRSTLSLPLMALALIAAAYSIGTLRFRSRRASPVSE
jgi:hypothetical protein